MEVLMIRATTQLDTSKEEDAARRWCCPFCLRPGTGEGKRLFTFHSSFIVFSKGISNDGLRQTGLMYFSYS